MRQLSIYNAFEETCKIEQQGLKDLIPFIEKRAFEGRFVIIGKGRLARDLQKSAGDVLFNLSEKELIGVEIKTEGENKTGNFFLEFWSNKSRFTPGWMINLKTDLLFYYFLKNKQLFIINFKKLQIWAFGHKGKNDNSGRIWDFPEKLQKKYNQPNDTWGRCVPIDIIKAEVGLKEITFN